MVKVLLVIQSYTKPNSKMSKGELWCLHLYSYCMLKIRTLEKVTVTFDHLFVGASEVPMNWFSANFRSEDDIYFSGVALFVSDNLTLTLS